MTKQLGPHVEELLMNGMEKASNDIRKIAEQLQSVREKQNELKEQLQHAFNTMDEIIELKGTNEELSLEFIFNGRVYSSYELKKYDEYKREMLEQFK